MSLSKAYYPHLLTNGAGLELFKLNDFRPSNNYQDLTEFQSSSVVPYMTGTHQASPDNRFSSPELNEILTEVIAGDVNCAASQVANTVDVEMRAGQLLGTRYAVGSSEHLIGRMELNSLLVFEGFEARQGQIAQGRCRLGATYDGTNEPIQWLDSQAITALAASTQFYTLGPQSINGASVDGVQSCALDNRVEYEEVYADGDGFLVYLGILRMSPRVTIMTRDTSAVSSYGAEGTALTNWTCYLKRKKTSAINYADVDTEHIKFVATTGTIKTQEVGGENSEAQITIDLYKADDTAPYTPSVGVAIT